MTRATAWLDRDDQRKQSYLEIQAENESSVNVYRHSGGNHDTGFRAEAGKPSFVASILARIDMAQQEAPDGTQQNLDQFAQYTALTTEADVYVGDMWQYYDMGKRQTFLRVVRVKPIESGSAVWLDEIKRERWPKV